MTPEILILVAGDVTRESSTDGDCLCLIGQTPGMSPATQALMSINDYCYDDYLDHCFVIAIDLGSSRQVSSG